MNIDVLIVVLRPDDRSHPWMSQISKTPDIEMTGKLTGAAALLVTPEDRNYAHEVLTLAMNMYMNSDKREVIDMIPLRDFLKEEFDAKDAIIAEKEKELEAKEQQLETQEKQLETQEKQLETKNKQLETKDKQLETKNRLLEAKDAAIEKLKQEVLRLGGSVAMF